MNKKLKENKRILTPGEYEMYGEIVEEVIINVEKDQGWLEDLNMLIFEVALDFFERDGNKYKAYKLIAENWGTVEEQVKELNLDVEAAAAAIAHETQIGEAIREQIK